MVTLNNADSVLKSFYLDAVSEALNSKLNPFLAKIEKTSANVTGKDVRKVISCGFNNGIGAGSETGDLPTPQGNSYGQMVATLKNFYGTLEISDKAIRASADSDGAFVNLLNEEMRTLINTAKFNFGRMLFGDGSGVLGRAVQFFSNAVVEMEDVSNFVNGMLVDIIADEETVKNVKIVFVDRESSRLEINASGATVETLTNARFTLPGAGENNQELTGLEAIFSSDELYGLERSVPGMVPYCRDDASTPTEEDIQLAMDTIEGNCGVKPNMIICSWDVRRALTAYYKQYNVVLPTVQLEGGFTALDFYGTPIVVDRFCPKKTMYLLNTDFFKLHQLCDWQWMETEDGKILKQTPGKPVYTATLVKYAELLCENPCAQGKIYFDLMD